MSEIDTAAIREDYEHRPWHPAGELILDMADEIDALRAENACLAEVEAERDELRAVVSRMRDITDQQSARLAAVEALCDEADEDDVTRLWVAEVRAAARGEGDR